MTRSAIHRLLISASLAVALAAPAFALGGVTQATPQPPATQPATKRSIMDIQSESMAVQQELAKHMSNPAVLTDPRLRDEAAPHVVPQFRKLRGLMEEAIALAPNPTLAEQFRAGKYQIMSVLVGFGDSETVAALEAEKSADASSALALGRYMAANDEQQKLDAIKQLDTIATESPENASVGQAAASIYQLAGDRATTITDAAAAVVNKLRGPVGVHYQEMIAGFQRQAKAARDFEEKHMSKPLVVEGTTLDGGTFSTASLKGKVVMVDFWATWCPPCIAGLPKVKEDYQKYHADGFEIVGISLDQSADPLKQFLASEPQVTWTQIYTEGNPQASAQIAEKLGIQAIPTVFLLDRNGMVRAMAIGGGDEMEKLHQMIPELLKEEAKPAESPQQ